MPQNSAPFGIILMNLGTPSAPTPRAIRRYLKAFLGDPRVVELPRPLWFLILNLLILPLRPIKIAHAYQSIWQDDGSPLRAISQQQRDKLQQRLDQDLGAHKSHVALAMTYGEPSVRSAWAELKNRGVDRVFILPLYPQYSATTTAAAFDEISRVLQKERAIPELRFCRDYHQHPAYIEALVHSIKRHWQDIESRTQERHERFLLFSFHGIPQVCIDRGDPYYQQCQNTAAAVAARLELDRQQWQISFQSRVGKAKWLSPYTDQTLKTLGKKLKRIDVICPGFSVDCLETLEEINIQNRAFYEAAGGQGFNYIPALNSDDKHIALMIDLITEKCSDWINPKSEFRTNDS